MTHASGVVRLGAVLVILVLFGAADTGGAFAQDYKMEKKVLKDLKGEDLDGRDGPFVHLSGDLGRLYRQYEQFQKQKAAGAEFQPKSSFLPVQEETVTIDALAKRGQGATLAKELREMGGKDLTRSGRLISGRLPIAALSEAARLASLHSAYPASQMSAAGAVTSQGDAALNADDARSQTGVDGSGVTVGVLSNSYDNPNENTSVSTTAQDDIDSGDLPPKNRISVLDDDNTGTDEGRAMMQILHDVAPGADLAFHTAGGGQANFAQGIRDLANAGTEVIVDDVAYTTEPWFQDGVVAEAVEEVTQNEDVTYFSAVGNDARQSHVEADGFTASDEIGPFEGPLHDFEGGDVEQQVTIPTDATARFILQWTDPYASASSDGRGADTDLDLYLIDVDQDSIVAASTVDNLEAGEPIEVITFTNDGSTDGNDDGEPDETYHISIEQSGGEALDDPSDQMRYIFQQTSSNQGVSIDEYQNPGPSSFGHTNAKNSHSVAAAAYFDTPSFGTDPPEVRSFSSEGGIPIFFDDDGSRLPFPNNRRVPDVTGPGSGNTTFFGRDISQDSDSDPNFTGTSAAAPHVAGVAALLRADDDDLSNNQVYGKLEATALDMDDPATNGFDTGYDRRTGYGFVQADQALQSAAVATSVSRSFGDASSAEDYRLVALPGQVDRPIENTVRGMAGREWQAFRDDGSDSDFLVTYDGSREFNFRAGNGFWLTSTQTWTDNKGGVAVDVNNGTTTIPLHSGWNIISNPFGRDVSWSAVETENGIDNPIWSFNGSFTNVVSGGDGTFDSAASGEAYYFFNEQGLDNLQIPDPGPSPASAVTKSEAAPMLAVSATPTGSDGPSSTIRVGLSPQKHDLVAPPGQFEAVSLRIKSGKTTSARSDLLMAERRPMEGDGETFALQLTHQEEGPVTLSAENVSAVEGRAVALLQPATGAAYDLRATPSVRIDAPEEKEAPTTLKLAVGTNDYVDDKIDRTGPEDVTLNSYPNPMQRQGTFTYGLPEAGKVTLQVYDMLGRVVTTLVQGQKQAGRHTVRLDAAQLSSGVYFGRLQVNGQTRTQKLTVVR